jgi:hypothetical protein
MLSSLVTHWFWDNIVLCMYSHLDTRSSHNKIHSCHFQDHFWRLPGVADPGDCVLLSQDLLDIQEVPEKNPGDVDWA